MSRLFFTLLLLFYSANAAQRNEFIYPPPGQNYYETSANQVFTVGQNVTLQWATNYTQFNLVLFQNNATNGRKIDGGSEYVKKSMRGRNQFNWNVQNYNKALNVSNVFYLMISDSNSENRFTSHWFNITRKDTSTPSALPSATQSTLPTFTDSPDNETGLSYEAKLGIGVGVGVGCAFFIALGSAIWYFRRRIAAIKAQSSAAASHSPAESNTPEPEPAPAPAPAVYKKASETTQPEPVEMHGDSVAEMPGDRGVELPIQQIRYELPP